MWPWVKLLNLGTQKLDKIMAFWEWLILFTKVRYFVEKTHCHIDQNCLSSLRVLSLDPTLLVSPISQSLQPEIVPQWRSFPLTIPWRVWRVGLRHLKTGSIGIHWDVESSPVRSGQGTSSWRRLVSRTLSSRNMWRSQIASKMGSSWMEKLGNHGALMYLFIYEFVYLFILLFIWLFI